MGNYFGTDGIRGIYGDKITTELAFKLGCALSKQCKNKKILIGRDTRPSGQALSLLICGGLISSGVDVIDVGIVPTPVISFLTNLEKCDYGIMITASHNEPQYNGIKIFDRFGYKISENEENEIEKLLEYCKQADYDKVGTYKFQPSLVKLYENKVLNTIKKSNELKIVVDCANGATYKVAKHIFSKICKDVKFINFKNNGLEINENCGALHPETLAKEVIKNKADFGFSFDGDGDRIIACDKLGNIFDGDDILYLLSKQLDEKEKYVVGTILTNKGLENHFFKKNVNLLRADVGDKYVAKIMKDRNINLGGEPCGHIIVKDFSKTGDGILVASLLYSVLSETNGILNLEYKKYPQININVPVGDKAKIMILASLLDEISSIKNKFKEQGRIVVRASGTENKIRVMCEHEIKEVARENAEKLQVLIESLDKS